MSDEDKRIIGEAVRIYDKWRGIVLTELDQWCSLTNEFWEFGCRHADSRLALHLSVAFMSVFDDLYHDGKKPEVPDYFGRSDM